MAGGGDLQGAKKRKREHAEGKAKPRPQVKGGGDGGKRKKHSADGGAGEAVARKKTLVTPKEKRLAAKVSLVSVRKRWNMGFDRGHCICISELKLTDGLDCDRKCRRPGR
jgi:pumilio family protein 6